MGDTISKDKIFFRKYLTIENRQHIFAGMITTTTELSGEKNFVFCINLDHGEDDKIFMMEKWLGGVYIHDSDGGSIFIPNDFAEPLMKAIIKQLKQ